MSVSLETKIPFGRNKGAKMKNLSKSYLNWIVEKLTNTDLHEFATVAQKVLDTRTELVHEDDLEQAGDEWLKQHGYNSKGNLS
jgi:uncharacterized protein (DUF3820 family)